MAKPLHPETAIPCQVLRVLFVKGWDGDSWFLPNEIPIKVVYASLPPKDFRLADSVDSNQITTVKQGVDRFLVRGNAKPGLALGFGMGANRFTEPKAQA